MMYFRLASVPPAFGELLQYFIELVVEGAEAFAGCYLRAETDHSYRIASRKSVSLRFTRLR